MRGRLGWATERALLYVTGGLAYGDVVASTTAVNSYSYLNYTDLFAGNASGIRYGYVLGGGLEYAVTNTIAVRGEYLYYNLGTATYAIAPLNADAVGEGIKMTGSLQVYGSLMRVGVDYRL